MSQEDQEGQEFVCHGAPCRCDKGSTPSPLQVTSHSFVWLQDTLQATSFDKTFVPFGTCALQNNQSCVPALLEWEAVFDLVTVEPVGCHPLLEKSTIRCSVGGVVSILSTLQVAVPGPPPAIALEESRLTFLDLAPLVLKRPRSTAAEPTSPAQP